MNRQEKQQLIVELKKQFQNTEATFFVNYQGLSVKELQDFRRNIMHNGGFFKVAKVRLIQHALGENRQKDLDSFCKGQIGIVFSEKKDYEMAKILHNFSKNNVKLKLIVGYSNDHLLTRDTIIQLALLPSREVLLAQVAGTVKEVIARVARFIAALKEKLEKEGGQQ